MANGTTDYKLGKLDEAVRILHSDVKELKKIVLNLRMWRIKVVAFSGGISTVIWILVSIVFKVFR